MALLSSLAVRAHASAPRGAARRRAVLLAAALECCAIFAAWRILSPGEAGSYSAAECLSDAEQIVQHDPQHFAQNALLLCEAAAQIARTAQLRGRDVLHVLLRHGPSEEAGTLSAPAAPRRT